MLVLLFSVVWCYITKFFQKEQQNNSPLKSQKISPELADQGRNPPRKKDSAVVFVSTFVQTFSIPYISCRECYLLARQQSYN